MDRGQSTCSWGSANESASSARSARTLAAAAASSASSARSASSAESGRHSGFEPAIPAPPWKSGSYKSSSYLSSSVGGEEDEPELGKRWCIFTPIVVFACVVVLFAEYHENAAGVNFEEPPTDGCHYRLSIKSLSFCAAAFGTNPLFGPTTEVLQRMGAVSGLLIRENGESWRLVLGLFLHGGAVHCAANTVALLGAGWHLERYHGFARVGLLYMVSGVFGAMATATLAPRGLSVGASGAIFGLIGASLGDIMLNWSVYPSPCASLVWLLFLVVLQGVLGTMPWLDNFAHVFGLLLGFVASLAVLDRLSRSDHCLVRCSRQCLRLAAGLITLAALALGVCLVYDLIEVDVHEACPECSTISCRGFPWGCEESESQKCWWTCSTLDSSSSSSGPAEVPCTGSVSFMGTETNGRVELNCPKHTGGSRLIVLEPFDVRGLSDANVAGLCPDFCPAS